MSRPLRIDVPGGWYHIMARGIERRAIFLDDRYREHFLELLEEMSARYGVLVHAYVLMDNHYHLILQTPEANASAAMQWLNVSYSAWFNTKQSRVGHVFQGRFKSVLIEDRGAWVLDASIYLHLNPVRTATHGLGQTARKAAARGYGAPSREEIRSRLEVLRKYKWSSYPAYAGYRKAPRWLQTEAILKRAKDAEKYRNVVKQYITKGESLESFTTLSEKVVLGSEAFLEKARCFVGSVTAEHTGRKAVQRGASFWEVVKVVEEARDEAWEDFSGRHGDWGRDMVLYLAKKRCGLTYGQIGVEVGGMKANAVAQAVYQFMMRVAADKELSSKTKSCLARLIKYNK